MKSIKEKANEYAKDYLFSPLPQRAPNVHFEAGANYVLEIVEQALIPQKCLTNIGINISPEVLIKTALQIIEQLKEK